MKSSVAELHVAYPQEEGYRQRRWDPEIPLEEAALLADEALAQPDPVKHLDALHDEDYKRFRAIGQSLLFLPPEVVIKEFGDEVAFWTAMSSIMAGDGDAIKAAMHEQRGFNLDDMETSRLWTWRKSYSSKAQLIMAQYGLMQSLKQDALEAIDLPKILEDSARDGVTLSAKRIDDYALMHVEPGYYNSHSSGGAVEGLSTSDTLRYDAWLDAPSGFILTYKGVPNAMAGLAMRGTNQLMMHQIQGIKGKVVDPAARYTDNYVVGRTASRGLMPLDWQKTLVRTTEAIAKHLDLPKTAIQSGENNVWTKRILRNDTEPHLPLDKAVQGYDVPAQRLGYEKDADDAKGNWHKTL